MLRSSNQKILPKALLLALLLIGAQSAALLHAFMHDVDSLQAQTCATCVTVAQLNHGCVAAEANLPVLQGATPSFTQRNTAFGSFDAPLPRQRGPPVLL